MTDFFNIIFRGFAPLVGSRQTALDTILENISPQPNQVIYELGSSSAKFLRMVEKKFSDVKLIGLEYSPIPFLISKLFLRLKNSRVEIRFQNMFKVSLQEADLIYCYLLPGMMVKLGEKIHAECRPGTILVSYTFSVPNWRPENIIKQDGRLIYFYKV